MHFVKKVLYICSNKHKNDKLATDNNQIFSL